MSALILIRKQASAEVVSDGSQFAGSWNLSGIGSKQIILARLSTVLVGFGLYDELWRLAGELNCAASFDAIVHSFAARPASELTSYGLIGWSARHDCPEAWFIPGRNQAEFFEEPGIPFHIRTVFAGGGDKAVDDFYAKFGASAEHFDAERDGIASMIAMRREPVPNLSGGDGTLGLAVGGFIEHATVTREGIATRVIHTWPEDQVGKPIEPTTLAEAA